VLVLRDDHTTVVVEIGFGGAWEAAIRATAGLSTAALRFGGSLHVHRATRRAASAAEQRTTTTEGERMQVSKNGITVDLTDADWSKSSLSGPYSDNCVEITGLNGALVVVRDSTDQDGPVLAFTAAEWDAFVGGAKAGEFDRS
jgi:membrane protein implicated in regulation of membrane protease activity